MGDQISMPTCLCQRCRDQENKSHATPPTCNVRFRMMSQAGGRGANQNSREKLEEDGDGLRSHIQDDTTNNQLESKLYKSRDSLDACCDMGGMCVYTYNCFKSSVRRTPLPMSQNGVSFNMPVTFNRHIKDTRGKLTRRLSNTC